MKSFKPEVPFDVAMKILQPEVKMVKGVKKKTYPNPKELDSSFLFFGSFRTFGGTENFSNDVYTVFDTAIIQTWFRPDITSECMIYVCNTGESYEVITPPENIHMRNQFLQFKVQKVGGLT